MHAVIPMAVVVATVLAAAAAQVATATPTYPLFAISNKPSDWTDSDVAVVANSFTAVDGVPADAALLRRLAKANPAFRSLRYCNPRGIQLSRPGSPPGALMTLQEFETSHRAE